MKDLYSLSLNDITPRNIAEDSNISALIAAIDPELQALSRGSLEALIWARIDELPENVIDLLAWQLHADFYDLAGTLDVKRKAVKDSLKWHMHKGTVWAIKDALRQIDVEATFRHWHDTGGEPYTFDLKAIVGGEFYRTTGRDKLQSSIHRAIEESKAARSLMNDLDIRIEVEDDAELATATVSLETRDVALGVNLDDMQELLLQFEKRIISRIDSYESTILADLTAQQAAINARLDAIMDMLRWKDMEDAE
ncbi:MAG: phage tail protein I [Synergistaceae bacterium]|nr:phage tail protein I [Synergistaceae bacterium]